MTDSVNYGGKKKQGLAIVCLICGILSLLTSFLLIGILIGFIGLIFGIIRLTQKPNKKGLLWTGLILSLLGILAGSGFALLYLKIYKQHISASTISDISIPKKSVAYSLQEVMEPKNMPVCMVPTFIPV